ncbi:MAG: hypothetical protein IJE74_00415 [Clostridia bacterium]|nr:hypothetical protein [Clostridia bacterium]
MTDFDKLKEAAEEIKLDDLQKQKILEACKGKKRRKINYTAIAAAAAVLVITVAVFSPGFLLKAGAPADRAENEMAVEDYLADEDVKYYSNSIWSQNSDSCVSDSSGFVYTADEYTQCIFSANDFRSIYSAIPQSFINLVNYEDFVAWSASVESGNGMAIVQFVEHFGISKEDFDNANRSYARIIYSHYGELPLYRAVEKTNELYEIYNTELIYSFDREAIDEYYKVFVRLDKNESGNIISGSSPAEIIVPEDYYK